MARRGDGEDRFFKVDEAQFGPEGIVAFKGDGTGQGKRPVEPRFTDEAAVGFGIEFQIALFADFRPLLDAKGGKIGVGRTEAQMTADIPARPEGDEARSVDRDVVGTVSLQLPQCLFRHEGRKAGFVEKLFGGGDGVVRRRGAVNEVQ